MLCEQVQLGGTSMRVARGLQGGRRGDSIDLSDESWQPSKLELQARLGASKERQLELEWRLQQAEEKIAQAKVRNAACPHRGLVHNLEAYHAVPHTPHSFVACFDGSYGLLGRGTCEKGYM